MPGTDYLYVILTWFVTGGAGLASREICEVWPWFQRLKSGKAKIVIAVLVSSFLGAGAYALSVAMLYEASPAGWRGWVGVLVSAAVVSSGLSQIMHRARKKFSA